MTFLDFCAKVRNNDLSIMRECGYPLTIDRLRGKNDLELADALLENRSITNLELETATYTKSAAEAMTKYVRTSKRLQRICIHQTIEHWMLTDEKRRGEYRMVELREEILCSFLHAFQESPSLKEVRIDFPVTGEPSNLALENMLTHAQSLRSLRLSCHCDTAAAQSGLKKNTTLRELTLYFPRHATTISSILTSVRDHPLLRRLCLTGFKVNLTGLETLLRSDTSKITELEIQGCPGIPTIALTPVLQALARRPTLTKLGLRSCTLGRGEARLLCKALRNLPSLQSLDLAGNHLGSAGLAELVPALHHNTSIKVLNMSRNDLSDMESAEILRDILRCNKIMTALDLSGNKFGKTTGAVECIAGGLGVGSNSTLLKIDLTRCALGDVGAFTLAQTLGSWSTTLQKLILSSNSITSAGVGVLLEAMEQGSHITDLELGEEPIGDEEAEVGVRDRAHILARSLESNSLPNLTRLSLESAGFDADGFIALVSALEQNTSLLHIDLSYSHHGSERAFFALAESLPKIKVLQELDLTWCPNLVQAMPSLLEGLRKNTSLFRIQVAGCAPNSVSDESLERAEFTGDWIQELERVGYRNRLTALIRAPKERLPPLSVWPLVLARVNTHSDVIFEVLRSKPNLVPSDDTEGKEATKDTGVPKKRKHCDE
jgi:hypothetical protein